MKWPPIEIIELVKFDIVVHSWVKDEWKNVEYDQFRMAPWEGFVQNPDFGNEDENNERLMLLKHGRHKMITDELMEADWHKAKITKENEKRIFLCPAIEWAKFSNGTYKASGTFPNIFPESKVNVQRADKIKEIVASMPIPPKVNGLIMVGSNLDSVFSIIEGCHRYTATIYLTKDKNDNEIISDTAYLGINPKMNQYDFHIGKWNPGL